MVKKISIGTLEASYAVVIATNATLIGMIVKDLLIDNNQLLFINFLMLAFASICSISIALEWLALKREEDGTTLTSFFFDILILCCYFISLQVNIELYSSNNEISLSNVALVNSVSFIVIYLLYFLWNIKTSLKLSKKICLFNIITITLGIVLFVFSWIQSINAFFYYTIFALFLFDLIFNCLYSFNVLRKG